jgi:hypothetical protein
VDASRVRRALALVLCGLLPGCAIHAMEHAKPGGSYTRSFDATFLRVSSTALAAGKSKIKAPERQPLQKLDTEDEKVSEQFEALVAALEREAEWRRRVERGEELEPLPLPLIPYRPTQFTNIEGSELSYFVDDREASEDLSKIVRTGIMAAAYAYLFGWANEAAGIGLDALDSP